MKDRRHQVARFAAAIAAIALPALWASWAGPRILRMPEDFRYEADIVSRDNFYDEKEARFAGEALSLTHFSFEALEPKGDVLAVKNVFEVRKPTGEKIFAVERLYGVDPGTGRHVSGAGDKDRDGYLFAPRGAAREAFSYWHVNYDAPARLKFQGEEEILGLAVHRYACDFKADQTENLGHLPGVPETRGVELEIHLEIWIEPTSGWMVKYEDHATAYYYDIKTRERLHPWNKFRNQYTEASIADHVERARAARFRARWAGAWGLGVWLLLAAGLALWAAVSRRRASPGFAMALASRLESLKRGVALICATISTLLGLAVMAGWALRIPEVIQVLPTLAPMMFNTALGFVLSGLGLWAHVSGRPRLARGAAAVIATLGLATLAQYQLGLDLGIDQLFAAATITVQSSHPGRMAPMTALCFILFAAALFLITRERQSQWAAVLGSVTAAAGGVAVVGYAMGLPQTYSSGPWTSMAVHTAAGFMVLGAGLLTLLWPSFESAVGPRRLAVAGGVSGLYFLFVLYAALVAREDVQVRRLLDSEAEHAARLLTDRTSERFLALRRMAVRWQNTGGTPEAAWRREASDYLEDFPGFQALSWVDVSNRVRWIVPLAGNEAALDLDLSSEETRRRALDRARRTRNLIVSRPVDLAQGGRGFLFCIPLYVGARFDGFIAGAFRFDRLLDVLAREIAVRGHAVAFSVDGELLYRHGPSQGLRSDLRVEKNVRFGPGASTSTSPDPEVVPWRLSVTPRREWAAAVRSSLPEVTFGSGIAVLTLAYLSLVFAWDAARRAVLLRREIETGLKREAKFRDFLEGAPDAVVIADGNGRIVLVNAQTEALFGYERRELLGQPVELLVPPRFGSVHPAHRSSYFAAPHAREMGAGIELSALRKDGAELPVEVSLSPLETEEGILAMSVIRDVSARREAQYALSRQADELDRQREAALDLASDAQEARLAAEAAERRVADSLREKEVLLQEVHHRVKNNLQVISSLMNVQVRALGNSPGRDALRDCETRVQTIALIHEKLYQSKDYARVPFSDYVRSLAQSVFQVTGVSSLSVSLDLALEDVALAVDKAIPCGLILNELITNALKHAFRDGRKGRILVELAKLDGAIRLGVSDDGVGLPSGQLGASKPKSFGLQLVWMLSKQLEAELALETSQGTSVRVTIPVEE